MATKLPLERVYLEVSSRCNLECKHCYRQNWKDEERDMPKELWQKSIQDIHSIASVKEIVLGGIGEPLIHPEIHEIITQAKDYKIIVTTNGSSLSENLIPTLCENVSEIIFSIDGTETAQEDLRGIPVSVIIDSIQRLQEADRGKIQKSIQMVISRDNFHETKALIDLAASLGIGTVRISHLLPQQEIESNKILYTLYDNSTLQKDFHALRVYSFRRGVQLHLPEIRVKTERRCHFIETGSTLINADGDVSPCYRFAHQGTEFVFGRKKQIDKYSFGNITERSLKEIYASQAYKEFRDTVYTGRFASCTDCDLVDGCDMVNNAQADCYYSHPSCGDCLWARNITVCQ